MNEQAEQVRKAIADLETQRSVLGDNTVEAALTPLRQKLANLEAQETALKEEKPALPTRHRKLVTLLYMDVVGSTAMTQHLDPEDTLEIMDNALPRLAAPIEAHGGHVTRYTGDGFKAVLGDPIAREDDPEQAIRAGLEILEVAKLLAQELETEWDIGDFQVRIGIDTGLAALGGQTEAEDTVMGRVVNLAVRIESATPPGGLLISHNTYRHVRGVFKVEPQEPIMAKGFPEPVQVYLVKEIKPRAFRVQTRGVEGVETQMVGRNDELRFLQDALMTAFEEGEGHLVTVSGEAGVGKSRLLYEFDNWLELLPSSQAVRFFQGRGRQEAQGSPYSLLRDVFAFRFQIFDDDTGEQARGKIGTGFGEVFGTESDGIMRAQILGQLLGFDFSDSPHLKGVQNDAEQLRNRGVMYLIQYFQAISKEMPVVIFLEDIHWGDDSSLDVVNRLGEHTQQNPILIVCAARPNLFERRPYWGEGQTYHTHIELRPLSKRESRILVSEILKLAVDIPVELRELVVRGAEGNPFYTEELVKMLIEDGVVIPGEETWQIDLTRLEEVDVPSTLAGVLQARLDGLPVQERTVLQQASVVGRLFWDRIVAYIQAEGGNGGDPKLIPQTLTSLRNRELVYRHEESVFVGAVEYLFKHDVLREVTYESVLKQLRKTYHGLVADWLIKYSGERESEYSGMIGTHLELAGKNEQAVIYLQRAGDQAVARFANMEALTYFNRVLVLTNEEDLEIRFSLLRRREEVYDLLADRVNQQQDLMALHQLAEKINVSEKRVVVALRQANFAERTSDYKLAIKSARRAITLASKNKLVRLEAKGYSDWGFALSYQGEFEAANEKHRKALELAQEEGLKKLEAESHRGFGIVSWFRGDLSQAQDHFLTSLAICREIDDYRGEAASLNNLGSVFAMQGNFSEAKSYYDQYLVSCCNMGDRKGKGLVLSNLGAISERLGDYEKAMDYHKEALIIRHDSRDRKGEAETLYNLGWVLYQLIRYQGDEIRTVDPNQINLDRTIYDIGQEVLQIACEIGDRTLKAYGLNLLGNALETQGDFSEAVNTYQQALFIRHELEQDILACGTLSCLARVSLIQGDLDTAESHVEEILDHLKTTSLDNLEPYLTCYQVLKVNQDLRAHEILNDAYELLQKQAGMITDDDLRHSFLNNVVANRDILREYEYVDTVGK